MKPIIATTASLIFALSTGIAHSEEWTPAWTASPEAVWSTEFDFPTGLPDSIAGQTIRQPLTLAWGGDRLRITLSNSYGTTPLPVDAAMVALGGEGAALKGQELPVLFGGKPEVTIPPGARITSDPVALPVEAGQRISVTLSYGEDAVAQDFHWDARETSFVIDGNRIDEEITARVSLAGVLTDHPAEMVVVAMGDSITDGNGAAMNEDVRWPDFLARRLAPEGVAVINAGISGGRLLSDGMGKSVLARIDRDVFAVPGVDAVVLLIGTNDIAWPGSPFAPDEAPMTLEGLQAGISAIAAKARLQGVHLIVGTVPPFRGALPDTPMEATYWSAGKDGLRREFNDWLRTTDLVDELVDFDAVLRDPDDHSQLKPTYDSGDRLHPGAAGNEAMAAAVSSKVLKGETP
ncbi:SGNH/GDSL hydrolase family protein [Paracoccus saliphilus]|uniref:Lysophospholipase L1 n=1 Tax=Paracoccus saliphilus TaxID=405559 RepID=A0AA45W8J8_9RHOB|nr:SGNH/GDSL hydrolase family protein [Paracoccus saliphilus]WCR02671.1 SGNH/GDSL hydrolase family protein [Paracoccus saliphilus]SIT17394.1 Lysophospholipase L1 [Paracoccus saliphilus]